MQRTRFRRGVWGVVLAMGLAGTGTAYAERLDDSASPRARVHAQLDLDAQTPGSPYAWVIFRGVEYRLFTARYVGRRARIYHVVPAIGTGLQNPSALRMEWTGTGAFAPGAVTPGDRQLVWSGTVTSPWINERLDLRLRVDLRDALLRPNRPFDLETYFDIELLP